MKLKRIISLVCCFVIILSIALFPATAFSETFINYVAAPVAEWVATYALSTAVDSAPGAWEANQAASSDPCSGSPTGYHDFSKALSPRPGAPEYYQDTCQYCGVTYSSFYDAAYAGFTQVVKDEYGSTVFSSDCGIFIPYVHWYTEFGYYSGGAKRFYCEHYDSPSSSVSSVGLCSSAQDSVSITYLDCSKNKAFFFLYWVAKFPFSNGTFSYLGSTEKHQLPPDCQVSYSTHSGSYNMPTSGEFTLTTKAEGGVMFYPASPLDLNSGIFASSRPSSITGNYGIIGDNGSLTKIDATTIVNEGSSTYYNPVTNTSYDLSGWTYDYSTRTYNLTTADDNSVTVTYGDENVTINEGDATYNVYYLVETPSTDEDGSGSGDPGIGDGSDIPGSGSDSNLGGADIWDKVGQLLGTVVDGILGLLEGVLGGLLDGLISLATMISDKLAQVVDVIMSLFQQIPAMFSGFLDFLSAVFPFIPEEMMTLLTFGLAAVIFLGILAWFRR